MVKKFDYQGIDLTELEKMPMEKLFQYFQHELEDHLPEELPIVNEN